MAKNVASGPGGGRPVLRDAPRRIAPDGGAWSAVSTIRELLPAGIPARAMQGAAPGRTSTLLGPGGTPAGRVAEDAGSFEEAFFARRVGTTIRSKWTLVRLIGVGGMAAVYAAVHRMGRRDALKMLKPEFARNRELAARFEREAWAVNRLRHPGAVEIRDIDVSEDGLPFLVMELLEGQALGERLEDGRSIPRAVALGLVEQLLNVLEAAHALGIIHRDIKPDNLIIIPDGRLKVIDFGVAQLRGVGAHFVTPPGIRLGTVGYMSPEQARGEPVDARADLFSVGATLFRMLVGRPLHGDAAAAEVIVRLVSGSTPLAATAAPQLDGGVSVVIDCALALCRDGRYPDAATMRDDIGALLRGEPPPFATAWSESVLRSSSPRLRIPSEADRTVRTGAGPLDGSGDAGSAIPAEAAQASAVPPSLAGRAAAVSVIRRATALAALVVTAELATFALIRSRHVAAPPLALLAAPVPTGPTSATVNVPATESAEAARPEAERPSGPTVSAAEASAAPAVEVVGAPEALPKHLGYLRIEAPVGLGVYVNGKHVGAPGDLLVAPCGRRFVRLGTPDPIGGVLWARPGRSVAVACGGVTAVRFEP